MNTASNQRFIIVAVPPLQGVSYQSASPSNEFPGSDGDLFKGKPGYVVVADAKTGKVRIVMDEPGHEEFDFGG